MKSKSSQANASEVVYRTPTDMEKKERTDVTLYNLSPEDWWDEYVDGTTPWQPVPDPTLCVEVGRRMDATDTADYWDGLNCIDGMRYETQAEYDQRVAEWDAAGETGQTRQPWRPERHEAAYYVYATLAGQPDQANCDGGSAKMAGSRASFGSEADRARTGGPTGIERRQARWKAASVGNIGPRRAGAPQPSERDRRLARRQRDAQAADAAAAAAASQAQQLQQLTAQAAAQAQAAAALPPAPAEGAAGGSQFQGLRGRARPFTTSTSSGSRTSCLTRSTSAALSSR